LKPHSKQTKALFFFSSLKNNKGLKKQTKTLDPLLPPVLSKVAPQEDGTADTNNAVDIQKGFHNGVFLQGNNDGLHFSWGRLCAFAAHATQP
jgi:hypothetical protein